MVDSLREEFANDPSVKARVTNKAVALGKVFKLSHTSYPVDVENVNLELDSDAEKIIEKQAFDDAHRAAVNAFREQVAFAKEHMIYEVNDIAVKSMDAELMLLEGISKKVNLKIDEGFSAQTAVSLYYQENIEKMHKHADRLEKEAEALAQKAVSEEDEQEVAEKKAAAFRFRKQVVEFDQHRSLLIGHLNDKPPATLTEMPKGSVLAVSSLSMNDLMHFIDPETDERRVEGIVVEEGSMHSHAMILAQSMGIPVARVDRQEFGRIKHGNKVIIDGADEKQKVFINPGADLEEEYQARHESYRVQEHSLTDKWSEDRFAIMQNGEKFNVHANYGMSFEAHMIRDAGARGLGLVRTEQYMDARSEGKTTVEDHLRILRNSMQICCQEQGDTNFIPMTVRTIDLAGDKGEGLGAKQRKDRELSVTKDQFKALLMLKQELRELDQEHNPGENKFERKLKAMIPNTRSNEHFILYQDMLDEAAEELGIKSFKLGSMIENSFSVYHTSTMDAEFFSIGTNDAYHHGAGIFRYDNQSNALYDPTEPAFLNMIQYVAKTADDRGIKASLCGGMASEVQYFALLVGCGLRDISAGAKQVDTLKELASRIDPEEAQALVAELKSITGRGAREKREARLAGWNKEHLGLNPNGSLDMEIFDTQTPSQIAEADGDEPDDGAHPA